MFDATITFVKDHPIELIAILISIMSMIISIYTLRKDKPILHLEKQSAKFNSDGKSLTFNFYLSNLGKQPTTIKEIEFKTKNNYKPKVLLFESTVKIIPHLSSGGSEDLQIEGAEMPFQLMPYSAKSFQAELEFTSNDILKREHQEDEIHYFVKIKHTDKKAFEKYI